MKKLGKSHKISYFHNQKKGNSFQHRRIGTAIPIRGMTTIFSVLFLLPYLITFFFGNLKNGETQEWVSFTQDGYYISRDTFAGTERIPMESYVAMQVMCFTDDTWESEAVKAFAVAVRTGILREIKQQTEKGIGELKVDDIYKNILVSSRCRTLVKETEGVYMTWQGEPIHAAYFVLSNGKTRNANEAFSGEEGDMPYLCSVPCERDFVSEEYSFQTTLTTADWETLWSNADSDQMPVLHKDSAGYVTNVSYGDKVMNGEAFREACKLPSASFDLFKDTNGDYLITGRGAGHGLGMSLFGANEMAKTGEDYISILHYFYQDVELTK